MQSLKLTPYNLFVHFGFYRQTLGKNQLVRIDTNAQHPASFKKNFRYNRSNSAFNSRLRQRKLKERRYRYSSLIQLSEDYT